MKKAILFASLMLCAVAAHVQDARAEGTAPDSSTKAAKSFVQSFYDWYVIKTDNKPDIRGTEEALKEKKQSFDVALYKELMDDQEAAAAAHGDLVGLDFDPFINANGLVYDKYQTGDATCKGTKCRVPVFGILAGKKNPKVVVEAEVGMKNGHCVFTNFHYGPSKFPQNENLLSVLAVLKKDRGDTGVKGKPGKKLNDYGP